VDALDRVFLERANELARRGIGNTSPNPAVGAVLTNDGQIAGEGYHHRAGEPHAEIHAIRAAGDRARGATLYVSLEPCNHTGRTPPCSHAVVEAGIARVVIGAEDPNPKTARGGIAYLQAHDIDVETANDAASREIIEPFARAIRSERPYVSLKMAMSLDGFIASERGVQQWLTAAQAREFVRDLRIAHDAVAVGAGTVRVDNPRLTVRPDHHRLQPYRRVVLCETEPVDPACLLFTPHEGYARTFVVAPAGARERFRRLEAVADVMCVGEEDAAQLDLARALCALRSAGISSMLVEGGPTLAAGLLRDGLVDRFYGLVVPRLLRRAGAVPVLTQGDLFDVPGLCFDRVERLGADLLVSAFINHV
jgi:diaminohydroxyphosphoribosylaminopyrimidine deaminase/5-amino-6-(5-phosphoribosylamino)uracil reductase